MTTMAATAGDPGKTSEHVYNLSLRIDKLSKPKKQWNSSRPFENYHTIIGSIRDIARRLGIDNMLAGPARPEPKTRSGATPSDPTG